MDIGAAWIRNIHVAENGWADIGYHFVIRRDGTTEPGRHLETSGAHTAGHNLDSIGICLVGGVNDAGKAENNFTPAQWQNLEHLVAALSAKYPQARVAGHRDFARKDCPCFDAAAWWGRVKDTAR